MDKFSLPSTAEILKKTSGSAGRQGRSMSQNNDDVAAYRGTLESGTNTKMARFIKLLLCVLVAVTAHALIWRKFERTVYAPEVTGRVASVSYMPGRDLPAGAKPLLIPMRQGAVRLVADPAPRQLHDDATDMRIPRARNALVVVGLAALIRRRYQAD